jgi:hypothetical protein
MNNEVCYRDKEGFLRVSPCKQVGLLHHRNPLGE